MRITHSLPPSLDKAHSFPTHEMMIATPADEASTDHYFLRGTVESPPRKRQKCCDDSASVFTGMDEWFSLSAGVSTCSVAANTGAQFFTDYSAAQKQSTFEEPQKTQLIYDPSLVKEEIIEGDCCNKTREQNVLPSSCRHSTAAMESSPRPSSITSPQRHEMQHSIASSCSRMVLGPQQTMPAPAPQISMQTFVFTSGNIRSETQDKTNELRIQKENLIQQLESGVDVLQNIFKGDDVLLNDTDIWRVCKSLPSILRLVEQCKKRQDRISKHPGFSLQSDILHLKQKKRTNHSSVYFNKEEDQFYIVFKREVLVCVYFNDIDIDVNHPIQWFFSEPNIQSLSSEQIRINNTEKRIEFSYAFEKDKKKTKTQFLRHQIALRDKRGMLHEAKFEMEMQGFCDAQFRKKVAMLERGVDTGDVIRKCNLEEIQLKVAKGA